MRETEAAPIAGGESHFAGGLRNPGQTAAQAPARVTPSSGRGRAKPFSCRETSHDRDAGAGLQARRSLQSLLPAVPELGEERGQAPDGCSSARFQGSPSSLLVRTPLPLPVREVMLAPAEHERHQRRSVQGKARTGWDFFSRAMSLAQMRAPWPWVQARKVLDRSRSLQPVKSCSAHSPPLNTI